jgi:hypothetical protein
MMASKVKGWDFATGEAITQSFRCLSPTTSAAGGGLNRVAHQAVNRILRHAESDRPPTTPSSGETFTWIIVLPVAGTCRLSTIPGIDPSARIIARLLGIEIRLARIVPFPPFSAEA